MKKKITGKKDYPVKAYIYENDALNPKWLLKRKIYDKILFMWERLGGGIMPVSFSGKQGYQGLSLATKERLVVCNNNVVTMHCGYIIEAKLDTEGIIENTILRYAPENIQKEINYHLNCFEDEEKLCG